MIVQSNAFKATHLLASGSLRASLMLLVWWLGYALVYAANIVGMSDQSGQVLSWRAALIYSLAGWLSWVPLSVAILAITRRYPIERGNYRHSIAIHTLSVLLVILLRAAYVYLTNPWINWYDYEFKLVTLLFDSVRSNFLTAWLVIGVAHAVLFAERARDREVVIVKLQAKLTQAKLDALSHQLNPHFLFNALNSVAELVHHDPAAADQMLVSLSALLRRSLASGGESELPLAAELELLAHYLAIEKVRLADRLVVQLSIDDACLDALVPTLVLQTLMENAVVHGVAKMPLGGRVEIRVVRRATMLEITLENDCAPSFHNSTTGTYEIALDSDLGAALDKSAGHGVGLRNIKQRLEYLYGTHATLKAGRQQNRFRVNLLLPFRTHSVSAGADQDLKVLSESN